MGLPQLVVCIVYFHTHILNRKSVHLLALTVSKKSLSHRVVETQKGERDRERRGRENQ